MSEENKGMFDGITAKDWIIGFFTGFLWIFYKMHKNGAPFGKIIGGFIGVIVIIGILGAIFGEKKPSSTNETVTTTEVKVDNSIAEKAKAEDEAKKKAEAERLAKEEEAKKKAEAERLAKEEEAKKKAEAEKLAKEEATKKVEKNKYFEQFKKVDFVDIDQYEKLYLTYSTPLYRIYVYDKQTTDSYKYINLSKEAKVIKEKIVKYNRYKIKIGGYRNKLWKTKEIYKGTDIGSDRYLQFTFDSEKDADMFKDFLENLVNNHKSLYKK